MTDLALLVFFLSKILGKNPVSMYVTSQRCNKTHFYMIYTV